MLYDIIDYIPTGASERLAGRSVLGPAREREHAQARADPGGGLLSSPSLPPSPRSLPSPPLPLPLLFSHF